MRYLIAPDKFKGSLTAVEVADVVGSAIQSVDPTAEIELLPIADGGEGTAALLAHHANAQRKTIETIDPIGRPIEAEYFVHGSEAIIEMSAASGLWRVEAAQRAPLRSNTYGTGIILWHLIEHGIERILVGLGGSATVDAGLGMAAALGYRFQDDQGRPIDPFPARFSEIVGVVPPIITRLPEVIGLADVETRLTGLEGAIYTFGPQKGLSPAEVCQLDSDLQALANRLERYLGPNFAGSVSSGAAGGFGFGIQTFLKGKLVSGFQVVAERLGLAERIEKADVVITGEGKIDSQSLHGKGPFGVATIAKRLNKVVWAVAGVIDDRDLVAPHFHRLGALASGGTTVAEALAQPKPLLHQRTRELVLAAVDAGAA
ncbi:MAG: glycerate kinase [Verrucomicrobia bacterium]|nr:glycerate kinase [Verrucomicrobiota bacterium]